MEWINITDKKEGKVILVGPFVGGWAYFFLAYYPMIHRIRQDNPDAIIVASGYLSDWWYLKDVADYYVGFEIDNAAERRLGRNPTINDPSTDMIIAFAIHNNIKPAYVYFLDGDDEITAHTYGENTTVIPRIPYTHDGKSNIISVWGRNKSAGRLVNNGSNEHWDRTIEYLLSKEFEVVVMGATGGSYTNSKVYDMTGLPENDRARLTTEKMSECLCSLHDCSSSANYTQFIGNPTMIFNIDPRNAVLFRRRNLFETLTEFYCPRKWDKWTGPNPMIGVPYDDYGAEWEKAIDRFIASAKTETPYMYDEIHSSKAGIH